MGVFSSLFPQHPKPDLNFAAKGYMQIAVTRRHAPHVDLHKVEHGYAQELLGAGCSLEQALSARWGGAYAISSDLAPFDDALAAYRETAAETGLSTNRTKEDVERMFHAAALLVVAAVQTADPREYGRFLTFIGA